MVSARPKPVPLHRHKYVCVCAHLMTNTKEKEFHIPCEAVVPDAPCPSSPHILFKHLAASFPSSLSSGHLPSPPSFLLLNLLMALPPQSIFDLFLWLLPSWPLRGVSCPNLGLHLWAALPPGLPGRRTGP